MKNLAIRVLDPLLHVALVYGIGALGLVHALPVPG